MQREMKQIINALIFIVILIVGWFLPLLGFFIPLCMLLGFAIGLFKGRKWCDWLCPRGSFYDTLGRVVPSRKNIPFEFRKIYLRLIVLIFLMIVMAVNLLSRWSYPGKMGAFFVVMLTSTTVFGVIMAFLFHSRSWCMICPIGTIIKITARLRNLLSIDSGLCIECKKCFDVCPVQIKPYEYKSAGIQVISDKDCLKCGSCIKVCPKKALFFPQK